ncbi:MAG: hypothetical protein H0W09_02700 [Solirubrobacterales bacterium]|nr:hypothetical protein [Solirubrobacterales bacterium]
MIPASAERARQRKSRVPRRLIGGLLSIIAALLVGAVPAQAAEAADPPPAERAAGSTAPSSVPSVDVPPTPEGYAISGRRAVAIADEVDLVRAQSAARGKLVAQPRVADNAGWEVGFFADDVEVAQVTLDGVSGEVREAWDGVQVAWRMARGYPEQFGHKLNAPYVWIPLALLFFVFLFDFRRPLRIVHLDLLVLLSFGVSNLFFNQGEIGVSAAAAYPPLLYLLGRMLWVGFGRRSAGLRPSAPTLALLVAALFLIGFRIAINVVDSGVIDVGYAGVIGADRIAAGEPIWGEGSFPDDNSVGDTYGPANYLAYLPFELALPWSGEWDELAAGHAAAIGFDLATILALFFLGRALARRHREAGDQGAGDGWGRASRKQASDAERRHHGNRLGAILVFAWVAFPYSTYALQSNSNDALVAALLAWSLVAFASPAGRGALLATASMVKFAPLALAPLYAAGERGLLERIRPREQIGGQMWRPRLLAPLAFAGAFALVTGLLLVQPALEPGLAQFYERTVASQLERESPFSVWGQEPSLAGAQTAAKLAAAALAVLVAFVPRRRSLGQIAALSAAVLIASQLALDHWFYLYIPWFLVGTLVALVSASPAPPGAQLTAVRASRSSSSTVRASSSANGLGRSSQKRSASER